MNKECELMQVCKTSLKLGIFKGKTKDNKNIICSYCELPININKLREGYENE